jgi:hypothetical protein
LTKSSRALTHRKFSRNTPVGRQASSMGSSRQNHRRRTRRSTEPVQALRCLVKMFSRAVVSLRTEARPVFLALNYQIYCKLVSTRKRHGCEDSNSKAAGTQIATLPGLQENFACPVSSDCIRSSGAVRFLYSEFLCWKENKVVSPFTSDGCKLEGTSLTDISIVCVFPLAALDEIGKTI